MACSSHPGAGQIYEMHLSENQIGTDAALDLVMTLKQFRQRRLTSRDLLPCALGTRRSGRCLARRAWPWCRCGCAWRRTRRHVPIDRPIWHWPPDQPFGLPEVLGSPVLSAMPWFLQSEAEGVTSGTAGYRRRQRRQCVGTARGLCPLIQHDLEEV